MYTYIVNHIPEAYTQGNSLLSVDWNRAEEGRIANFPWETSAYQPESRFYVLYSADSLFCLLLTRGEEERPPRAVETAFQAPVSQDSCLEFFFAYDPEQPYYFNLETNYNALTHLGFGPGRGDRWKPSQAELAGLRIEAVRPGEEALRYLDFSYDWGVGVEIPERIWQLFWQEETLSKEGGSIPLQSGREFRANFYKCGDRTASPHYACWSPVLAPQPDYHRPEFFGRLILE